MTMHLPMESPKCDPPNKTQKQGCMTQGPGTPDEPHTCFSSYFHLPITPANPQIKTHDPTEETHKNRNTHSKPPTHMVTTPRHKTKCTVQTSTTHPLLIQIKPPEMTTHPNRHPPICKTEYKACDQGAKSVPHTHFSGSVVPSLCENPPNEHTGKPQYAQPPKPKEPTPQNNNQQMHVPHTCFGRFLPPMKTHLMSTQASPQYTQPPKPRGPSPQTQGSTKSHTTHLLWWVCGNFKFVIWTQHPQPHQMNMGE
ncbi:hypothetical protein BS47DRAFT_1368421 [Hydnum rufescens UP504]|uniref:Uncharacterized protein n=1 Tax=Hydnum rufescens UP504 TaxID=1448309 RepID=A0A9P6AGM2_9AGAM|nr:hypothetical protein BS47DRAFT_1368421 [Hydnum rufescens UP504]